MSTELKLSDKLLDMIIESIVPPVIDWGQANELDPLGIYFYIDNKFNDQTKYTTLSVDRNRKMKEILR